MSSAKSDSNAGVRRGEGAELLLAADGKEDDGIFQSIWALNGSTLPLYGVVRITEGEARAEPGGERLARGDSALLRGVALVGQFEAVAVSLRRGVADDNDDDDDDDASGPRRTRIRIRRASELKLERFDKECIEVDGDVFREADLSVAEVVVGPRTLTALHRLDVKERYVVIEGEGDAEVGDSRFHFRAPCAFLVPRGVPQRVLSGDSGLRILCVCTPAFVNEAYHHLEDARRS